jgi:pyruvate/2-oxoglutarate dehydrogenase complex dihydrolipoamide acyltransferase (E2) component
MMRSRGDDRGIEHRIVRVGVRTPLLNPGMLSHRAGAIAPRALVVDGGVEARPACTLSCTFDHRVLDGATIGRALGDLVGLLSSRERLEALPR